MKPTRPFRLLNADSPVGLLLGCRYGCMLDVRVVDRWGCRLPARYLDETEDQLGD